MSDEYKDFDALNLPEGNTESEYKDIDALNLPNGKPGVKNGGGTDQDSENESVRGHNIEQDDELENGM